MTKRIFAGAVLALAMTFTFNAVASANARSKANIHDNSINQLISQMTLAEKIDMIGGTGFGTKPLPRLGIPSLEMVDGPVGVRGLPATAFPSGISMGATFNQQLIHDVADTIAQEARYFGKNVLLGPTVNLSRHPFGGRNFESFGEDPYLSGELAFSYVKGIQGQNVLGSIKHFALNEQEEDRMFVDVRAGVRPMIELHFPAFKKAIDAGVWTVMASYNKVNGHHATENAWLLKSILKKAWNFQGLVVSDWVSVHSTIPAALNGLDLEMPFGTYFNETLLSAVQTGEVPEPVIDDKVRRILRAMYGIGLLPAGASNQLPAPLGPENAINQKLALKAAHESIVLLKNKDQILPLKNTASIAVLGPNAEFARTGGGGSSHVNPYYEISPLEGLRQRGLRNLVYSPGVLFPEDFYAIPSKFFKPSLDSDQSGLRAEYFQNKDLAGQPALIKLDKNVDVDFMRNPVNGFKDDFSVRWSGYLIPPVSGSYQFKLRSDDGVRLFIGENEIISSWIDQAGGYHLAEIAFEAGKPYPIRIEYYQSLFGANVRLGWHLPGAFEADIDAAVNVAARADVALIFAGLSSHVEGEGVDRKTMELPKGQKELILKVAKVNPNTIVILNGGNPVAMKDWLPEVKGVLYAWYPGQEGGRAIADILYGDVNPSGKLPVTFLKSWSDSPAFGNYPGVNGIVHYHEGIFLGYRHFDAKNIDVHFPFGFGLSYTDFSISDFQASKSEVSVKVTNNGKMAGAEVVQMYVGEIEPKVPRPLRELKGFQKVHLQPGEAKLLKFTLDETAYRYFDEKTMSWKIDRGSKFKIWIGNSSRHLPYEKVVSF